MTLTLCGFELERRRQNRGLESSIERWWFGYRIDKSSNFPENHVKVNHQAITLSQ